MRQVETSAKRFEGSRLKKRTGKSAASIYTTLKASRTGFTGTLTSGRSAIWIWENKARKAYTVRPKKRVALKIPGIGFRSVVRIRRQHLPRPVLKPAVDRNEENLRNAAGQGLVETGYDHFPRIVGMKKK